MYLCLGNSRMESGDYEGAIQSFELARTQLRPDTSHALLVVSLVSFPTVIAQHIEMDLHI